MSGKRTGRSSFKDAWLEGVMLMVTISNYMCRKPASTYLGKQELKQPDFLWMHLKYLKDLEQYLGLLF